MEQIKPEATLQTILSDPNNNRCADCGGSPIKFVSLNNGIFLCENCRSKHSELDPKISNIKLIDEKVLTLEDIKFLALGGNANFEKFTNTYGITAYPSKTKYNTFAAQYYRDNVRKV